MAFYADRNELWNGECLLYRRMAPSGEIHPIWQMRLKLQKGYWTRSCKTRNYENAVLVAKTELDRIKRRQSDGAPLQDWTFALHWQDWFDREVRRGTWSQSRCRWHQNYFNRYFSAYFGTKPLNDITVDFADDYWEWRVKFWKSAEGKKLRAYNPKRRDAKTRATPNAKPVPKNSTLRMERSALNQIFDDAFKRRRLEHPIHLRIHKTSRRDAPRPAFDEAEWIVLTKYLHDWAEGMGKYQHDRLNSYHRRQRHQLRAYVLFMASSGLRVGEARIMRWADVNDRLDTDGNEHFLIKVREETKQGARIVTPMTGTSAYLAEWFLFSGRPRPQQLVFHGQASPATVATDLNKTFQAFLRTVPYNDRPEGLLFDADDHKRSVYSLRHTFATLSLLRGELTELEVARNMGTSVAQIEKHYSHVKNIQKASKFQAVRLPGLNQSATKMSVDQEVMKAALDKAYLDEIDAMFPDEDEIDDGNSLLE